MNPSQQRGKLKLKMLILGYVIIFITLSALFATGLINVSFFTPVRPTPAKVHFFPFIPLNYYDCFQPFFHQDNSTDYCGGLSLAAFFSINATYLITFSYNSTAGVSVFILPGDLYGSFIGSLYSNSIGYYTYYSGQVKFVHVSIALPAGYYCILIANLGNEDSFVALTEPVMGIQLSK